MAINTLAQTGIAANIILRVLQLYSEYWTTVLVIVEASSESGARPSCLVAPWTAVQALRLQMPARGREQSPGNESDKRGTDGTWSKGLSQVQVVSG